MGSLDWVTAVLKMGSYRGLAFSLEGGSQIYKKSSLIKLRPPYLATKILWTPTTIRYTYNTLNRLKLYWNQSFWAFLNKINTLSVVILWLPLHFGHQKFYDPHIFSPFLDLSFFLFFFFFPLVLPWSYWWSYQAFFCDTISFTNGWQPPRGGGHSTFFQVGVCGPDFRSVGLANWHLPLKRGACERKISQFGGLWAENSQIWGFVSWKFPNLGACELKFWWKMRL